MAKQAQFSVGDKVAYSRRFLASIGGHCFGHWRGTILELRKIGNDQLYVATVRWDNVTKHTDDVPSRILTPNLVHVAGIPTEAV